MKVATKDIALTASMATLYVILGRFPGFPVIGVDNASIGVVSTVVPIFGFLLGPWLGASAAFLGGFVSRVLFGPNPFTWLTLPAMPLSAFTAGCLSRRRIGVLRGWVVAALVLGALILVWYATWIGQLVLVFPLLHCAALAVILIFRGWLALFIQQGEGLELSVCVALCGFAATMVAQMYGTLAFFVAAELGLIGVPLEAALFFSIIPVAAVERLIITAIVTVLSVPILLTLRR